MADFRLRPDGPAVGTGIRDGRGVPIIDLDGVSRMGKDGIDLGAYVAKGP